MDTIQIPEKTYFKIGEVAKLLDVEPYVLRYWESEFDILTPEKTKSGQRIYQRDDIELLVMIRDLLYHEMFTIAGARRQLQRKREGKTSFVDVHQPQQSLFLNDPVEQSAIVGQDGLVQERDQAIEALASVRKELDAATRQRDELAEKLGAAEHDLESAQTQNSQDTVSQEVWQRLVDELRAENEDLRRDLSESQARVQQLQKQSEARNGMSGEVRARGLLEAMRREVDSLAALAQARA